MKKVSFIIPHFKTWLWTAICLNALKTYGIPIEQEIILVDNSPGHPSIKAITETSLGDGIKIVQGDPEFASHGMAYDIGLRHATGDWVFACETDSFPTRCGWFDEWIKASAHAQLIGPEVPQSSGRYIHPAGALYSREIFAEAEAWRKTMQAWLFCPGAAIQLGTNTLAYHVVAHTDYLDEHPPSEDLKKQIAIWSRACSFQEMRSFDTDSFGTYPQRTGIDNFAPSGGQLFVNKIGYEAGQWLAYFAEKHGFRIHKADTRIEWMKGHEWRQALYSEVSGGFRHVWCGTVSNLVNDIPKDVRETKLRMQIEYFLELPENLRTQIINLEAKHGA